MTALYPPEPPRGAAREYLERERQRAEAAPHFRTTASEAAADRRNEKTAGNRSLFWRFVVLVLIQDTVLVRFIGWGPTLLVSAAALMAYICIRRYYLPHPRRRRRGD